jgi:hypothetical protein
MGVNPTGLTLSERVLELQHEHCVSYWRREEDCAVYIIVTKTPKCVRYAGPIAWPDFGELFETAADSVKRRAPDTVLYFCGVVNLSRLPCAKWAPPRTARHVTAFVSSLRPGAVYIEVRLQNQTSFGGAYHAAMELMYTAAEAFVDSAKAHQGCSVEQCVV